MTELDLKKVWTELNRANTQIDANTIAIRALLRALSKDGRDLTEDVTRELATFADRFPPDADLGRADVDRVIRMLQENG